MTGAKPIAPAADKNAVDNKSASVFGAATAAPASSTFKADSKPFDPSAAKLNNESRGSGLFGGASIAPKDAAPQSSVSQPNNKPPGPQIEEKKGEASSLFKEGGSISLNAPK